MSPLRARAHAKVNLGLFVGPRRPSDARHELVTVMQAISLADELVLEPAPEASGDEVLCPGVEVPAGENLAARALSAFRAATGWSAPPQRLRIQKSIPVAAGMAGGSADAAAALGLAARASGLGDRELLLGLAAGLGADVPAMIQPGRWLARGAGEQLTPLPAPRAELGVLVLPLAQPLSTAAVYAEADRLGALRSATELERLGQELTQALADGAALPEPDLLVNDLQAAALSLCPAIEAILELARGEGARLALVSGSGPTVIGLFSSVAGAERAAAALGHKVAGALAARALQA